MRRAIALAAATALIALTGGCGLRPLYQGGGSGVVARELGGVAVAPIDGKAGWLVSHAVADRLGEPSDKPRYRLEIELDDQISGFGVRTDDAITRERRTLRARYRLVDADAGTVLLDTTASADAGIDVVNSGYATIAAENTALENLTQIIADQIVARVALYASRTQEK